MPSPDATAAATELLPALRRLDELLARALDAARDLGAPAPGEDPFRGLYLSHDDVARSLVGEPGAPFGLEMDGDGPTVTGRLATLASAFSLSAFDVDLLVIALAPEIDLRYERIYAYLQDDVQRRRPSVDLALSLLCGSAEEKLARRAHLAPYAPLVRFGLVEAVASDAGTSLARPLVADEQIVNALLGIGGLDRRCGRFASVSWPQRELDVLAPDVQERVAGALGLGLPARFAVHGREGAGHRALAEAVATALSVPLVAVDVPALLAERDVSLALRVVFRERWLRGAVLFLDGLGATAGPDRAGAAAAITAALARDMGAVVLASREQWRPPLSEDAQPLGLVRITLRAPEAPTRRDAWMAAGADLPPAELDALAERFVLCEAQIHEAVASALAQSAEPTRAELFAAARAQSAQQLDKLAGKQEPSASWGDLVVPEEVLDQLRELSGWVTGRGRVLREWGFGRRLARGRGATALFAGPPGTGKTLAAEVVAAELGLDLYRIDLSGIVSKYIGETEKNLDRIFTAAEDANAVLFFDEADALFGQRSEVRDAHDRYANIEVSYLLQKMEEYEGVAILATNLRDNLDAAFMRRLAFVVTFPFPEEDERRRIWESVWPADTPLADDLDLEALAVTHRLSGGQIKNAALAASYLAASNGGMVARDHVEDALRREYEKLGGAPQLEAVE